MIAWVANLLRRPPPAAPAFDAPRVTEIARAVLRQELAAGSLDAALAASALRAYRVFGDPARLRIAPSAVVNDALFNLSSGTVTVGEWAFFGHDVALLTGTHDLDRTREARQSAVPATGRDIVVGAGAWIATRAVVLGPCTIGEDAVVAAGSVVTRDVPPRTIVAGVPARIVRRLA